MAQHFLLSPQARSVSILSVASMSEKRAYAKLKRIMWDANGGKPICPHCGGLDHWELEDDKKWRCKACRKSFSLTSETIFKDRKLSFRKILAACVIFANGVMGVSACRLSRELDISYKSAWVLLQKVRDALGQNEETAQLAGVVEIDGAVFGGSMPRLPNSKKLWEEFKRKNKAAAKKRQKLIVVMRERDDPETGKTGKLRTFLLPKEGDAIPIARDILLPDTIVHADMSPQWEPLQLLFETKRINHSEHFSHDGACTNMAESFFERMRSAERGVHKHISGAHLHRYAMELAWKEQNRRVSNGEQAAMMISAVGKAPPSKTLVGYWQGRKGKPSGNGNSSGPANDQDDDAIAYLTGRTAV